MEENQLLKAAQKLREEREKGTTQSEKKAAETLKRYRRDARATADKFRPNKGGKRFI